MSTRSFARKSEKNLTDSEQLSYFDEIEELISDQTSMEPASETVIVPTHTRRKRRGKPEAFFADFTVKVVEHTLTEEELKEHFSVREDNRIRKLATYVI